MIPSSYFKEVIMPEKKFDPKVIRRAREKAKPNGDKVSRKEQIFPHSHPQDLWIDQGFQNYVNDDNRYYVELMLLD